MATTKATLDVDLIRLSRKIANALNQLGACRESMIIRELITRYDGLRHRMDGLEK